MTSNIPNKYFIISFKFTLDLELHVGENDILDFLFWNKQLQG
jgi:hypothetical protein